MSLLTDLLTKTLSKPSLPLPDGPFQVGHVDVMTPGTPQEEGSFFRLHYPAPAHTKLESPQVWSDSETRHGLVNFVQKMAWNWPSWVNQSEFLLLPHLKKILNPEAFTSAFNTAWKVVGKSLTIPIVHGAAMEPPLTEAGWPVSSIKLSSSALIFNLHRLLCSPTEWAATGSSCPRSATSWPVRGSWWLP